ncbi:phytoene desaturase [Annulohypoxylon maeteangense]|uniref:phytoene desaturase n=1 Tax=Annulohypoxylon maeteangense TaxID=1927788 RepID=UPI0020074A2C|nr:phytoene desaturase [Annulohypoxylon maeteangense]KAI0885979.1 phytoene desaturase [Annulohypoxylon maeteangense]
MTKITRKKAIVIGAGAGGIATAARLAQSGFSVTVVEKNPFTGGRCSIIQHAGYRFDQGPSLLLLPKLFHETFHDLDTSLEKEGVELLRCPSNYSVWFADGAPFELTPDLARMKTQIERYEGVDGFKRYLSWLREAHDHYELSVSEVLHRNFTSFWDLLSPGFVWTGLKIHPLHSIWGRASKYFWTERLRRVFTFATMYMGMSPFDAPATYSLLQYSELAEGIWYPKGGFHSVLEALVRVGRREGVEFRLGTAVKRILTSGDGRTAKGVELESGETLDADVVVVNADLVYAYSNLFPQTPSTQRYAKSLQKRDSSCSSISFYWALDRKVPELQTHNIFLADEYRESFDAIFDRKELPKEPSFYVNVPSRVDPSAAPEGCDAIIVLVPTGHLLQSTNPKTGLPRNQDWPALISQARTAVLSTISARTGCAPLQASIIHESVNDPLTWEARFNLDKGSILGLGHGFFNVLSFRPSTRARGLKNAYFVGASTHPGTGVPIVLAGAKITAEQILGDFGMDVPWRGRGDEGVGRKRGELGTLDKIERPSSVVSVVVVCSLLVLVLALMLRY